MSVSIRAKATTPKLWWLLIALLLVLVIFPVLGALVGLRGFGSPLVVAALPMAFQFDLSQSLFRSIGPLHALTCCLVTVLLWTVIAVLLWILIRWLWSFRYRNI